MSLLVLGLCDICVCLYICIYLICFMLNCKITYDFVFLLLVSSDFITYSHDTAFKVRIIWISNHFPRMNNDNEYLYMILLLG